MAPFDPWISTSLAKPLDMVTVIAYGTFEHNSDKVVVPAYYNSKYDEWRTLESDGDGWDFYLSDVTHFAHLPEPPK